MSVITDDAKRNLLVVYPPDTRGVQEPRYGKGNLKIGLDVYTYSRLPGTPHARALGVSLDQELRDGLSSGTCPGATAECQAICYAARPATEDGIVYRMWRRNSDTEDVPPIPDDCELLRIHVSGDFTSPSYIHNWFVQLNERPDVTAWAYTRSWRVPELLPHLELLRSNLPNLQLFASMDSSTVELPPAGWRRAWIDGDDRADLHVNTREDGRWKVHNRVAVGNVATYICPEETKRKANCVECQYCITGKRNDVTFLKH